MTSTFLEETFKLGEFMLLFNFRLNLFSRKLSSRWIGPYQVLKVFDHGVVEIWSERRGAFKANEQRLKHHHQEISLVEGTNIILSDALKE
jgi:hypothetical protein